MTKLNFPNLLSSCKTKHITSEATEPPAVNYLLIRDDECEINNIMFRCEYSLIM